MSRTRHGTDTPRERIVRWCLEQTEPFQARDLARAMGFTPHTARRHLYALEEERLVECMVAEPPEPHLWQRLYRLEPVSLEVKP